MIVPSAAGIVIEILVNGRPLPEYIDPSVSDTHDAVTRYVESNDGATFEIRCAYDTYSFAEAPALTCTVFVDGNWTQGKVWEKSAGMDPITYRGPRIAPDVIKTYRFGRLTIDDASQNNKSLSADAIGCIMMKVYTCVRENKRPVNDDDFEGVDIQNSVSGKHAALHTLSHFVEYGMTEKVQAMKHLNPISCKQSLATFKFLYRSRADLQSLLILPRDAQSVYGLDTDVTITSTNENVPRMATPESEGPPSEDEDGEGKSSEMVLPDRTKPVDPTDTDMMEKDE